MRLSNAERTPEPASPLEEEIEVANPAPAPPHYNARRTAIEQLSYMGLMLLTAGVACFLGLQVFVARAEVLAQTKRLEQAKGSLAITKKRLKDVEQQRTKTIQHEEVERRATKLKMIPFSSAQRQTFFVP